MPIIARNAGGAYEPAPQGTHPARCYKLINIGTVNDSYQGQPNRRHLIQLGWELPTQLMGDGRPYSISQMYTLSLNEKSNLRPLLVGWRGREFTPQEEDSFDVEKVLGHTCMLVIIHDHKQNGDVKARVQGAYPVQGIEVPPQVNDTELFDVMQPNMNLLEKQAPFIRDMVKRSEEWAARTGYLQGSAQQGTNVPTPQPNVYPSTPAQGATVNPSPYPGTLAQGAQGIMDATTVAAPYSSEPARALPQDFDDDIPW